jgi:hypothetical protein
VAADHRLLRVALAVVGQPPAVAAAGGSFDNPLDAAFGNPLGDQRRARRRRFREKVLGFVIAKKGEAERCRRLLTFGHL